MRLLYIHAHFDDFEFTAAGTFERWRQQPGGPHARKVIVCTDGAAGHQFRTREETAAMRLREQLESARAGEFEFELLRFPDGRVSREACLQLDAPFLAALWKAIRDFEPDYLFAPPLPVDPLAGVHVDHLAVAEALRRVAYLINVPHCFTPEYPCDERQSRSIKTPVILSVHDGYMSGANQFDLAVDIEPTFDLVARMSWCHQSQIREWLPWVGRHNMSVPASHEEWRGILRDRFARRNRELELPVVPLAEAFTVTAWGEVPDAEQLLRDFPNLIPNAAREARLRARLRRWRGEA